MKARTLGTFTTFDDYLWRNIYKLINGWYDINVRPEWLTQFVI